MESVFTQIRFDVKEREDEVLVGLTQKTGRGDETADKKTTVGFTIMRVSTLTSVLVFISTFLCEGASCSNRALRVRSAAAIRGLRNDVSLNAASAPTSWSVW